MLSIEEIVEKLQGKNLSKIAKSLGVTRSYIWAISKGVRVNPSYEMVKKLSDHLLGDKGVEIDSKE